MSNLLPILFGIFAATMIFGAFYFGRYLRFLATRLLENRANNDQVD